ncbi:hypothetical protein B0T26DRAFT_755685 [Lasiosphaeria miniovina]|uniref:Extracellular membrane protein CFEM domain-containing protein n=1 Tax=Lasiosphaeria miniovina TaxID=1954250 RepID=A0AA39ZYU3_9PEZI|nr:uncharacterized protein B0T26DRAFT_755685 [Lasiosphaeria miniovina]KAK0706156.1 hypothetical protein B0T26DRAFT_755685 [Lasiosphaeria miniovina]
MTQLTACLSMALAQVLLTTVARAQLVPNWSAYPIASQQCLAYYEFYSGCSRANAYALNACLCSNGGGWVVNVAQCVEAGDAANLDVVYGTLKAACITTGTPISFSLAEWRNAAGAASDAGDAQSSAPTTFSTSIVSLSTKPATPGQTPTPTPTPAPQTDGGGGGSGGLSTSDKIAVGIGVPVGVFSIIGAIVAWYMCCHAR